jgi:glucuronate isomerase
LYLEKIFIRVFADFPMAGEALVEALKTLMTALGAEASKGLVYWMAAKTADTAVSNALNKLVRGQQLTAAELEQLRAALAQAAQPQQVDVNQLARQVAEILKREGFLK